MKDYKKILIRVIYIFISLVVIILFWQILTTFQIVPSYILPSFWDVIKGFFFYWKTLVYHGFFTLIEAVVGFGLALTFGFLLAILFYYSRTANLLFYPYVVGLQGFPKEALAPLFILWFGYGMFSKIFTAFLIAIFPIIVNTIKGLDQSPEIVIDELKVWQAPEFFIFQEVRLWYALPFVLSAAKVSVTLSFIGAVVGEFLGADRGLGYLINLSRSQLNLDLLFACLLTLFLMSVIMFLMINICEKIIAKGKFN